MKINVVEFSDDKLALIFLSSAKSKEAERVTDVTANRGEFSVKSVWMEVWIWKTFNKIEIMSGAKMHAALIYCA